VTIESDLTAGSGDPAGRATGRDRAKIVRPKRRLFWALLAVVGSLVAAGVGGAVWMLRGFRPAAMRSVPVVSSFRQITFRGAGLPSLSADGRFVAYSSASSGNFDVYLQDVESQLATNLTRDSKVTDTEPAISPDGERIAFRSARQGGGIYLTSRLGEAPVRLTDFGYSPAWSPDGRFVAVASETAVTPETGPLPSAIWIVNVATGEKRRLATGEALSPQWSPHALRIAYSGGSDRGRRVIWTVSVSGREAVPLTTHGANSTASDWGPVWAPDGRSIYFVSDRSGARNLWTAKLNEQTGEAEGEPQPTAVPGELMAIAISRDGSLVACAWTSGSANIQRVGIDPGSGAIVEAPEWVTQGNAGPANVAVSLDGELLAFSAGPALQHIFVGHSDGTGVRQVSSGNDAEIEPRWSPEGRDIVFTAMAAAEGQLRILARGTAPSEALTSERGWRHPVWSPDGTRIAAVNRIGEIGMFNPAARNALPVSRHPLPESRRPVSRGTVPLLWDWSPDGKLLAGEDSSGPFVYNVESGECIGLGGFSGPTAFLPDSRRLLVADSRGRLMFVDSATNVQTNVLSVAPDRLVGLSLTRDGRQLFILRASERREIFLAGLSGTGS
jgi:Tol biopolymer transport system component